MCNTWYWVIQKRPIFRKKINRIDLHTSNNTKNGAKYGSDFATIQYIVGL